MTLTSKHLIEQKAPGKYNCHYDSWVHGDQLQGGSSDDEFGDVTEYGLWTGRYSIEGDTRDELEAVDHYGTRHLIIQEDGDGFVNIGVYENVEDRDAEFQRLSELYFAWADETVDEG